MKHINHFGLFLAFWIISVAISFGLLGLIIYVAWHFISKYW